MENREWKSICHDPKSGNRIAISPAGELWQQSSGRQPAAFNEIYRGYYPECRFSDAIFCERGFYAAGTTKDQKPILFYSARGTVWNREELAVTVPPGKKICLEQKINRLLYDDEMKQLFILCEKGSIAILPDCPKCMKIHSVSRLDIIDGRLEKEQVVLFLSDGTYLEIPKNEVGQFRISLNYARKNFCSEHYLVGLGPCRTADPHLEEFLKDSIYLSEDEIPDWLDSISRTAFIFFFCPYGVQADRTARYARRLGWINAFSLGGIQNGFYIW